MALHSSLMTATPAGDFTVGERANRLGLVRGYQGYLLSTRVQVENRPRHTVGVIHGFS